MKGKKSGRYPYLGMGMRRIDFLEGQTMFLGLSPGDHVDKWHLHVGKEYESFAQ